MDPSGALSLAVVSTTAMGGASAKEEAGAVLHNAFTESSIKGGTM